MSLFFCILSIFVALICESHAKKVITLTRNQKNAIISKHNYYRRQVAKGKMPAYGGGTHPRATNMIELQWDEALAWSAASYAATCPTPKHDSDKDRIARFRKARKFEASFESYPEPFNYKTAPGQNIAFKKTDGKNTMKNLEGRIMSWMLVESEKASFDKSMKYKRGMTCSEEPYMTKCGHFTTGAWAETKYVGCGLVLDCPVRKYTFICNYWPPGNWIGREVYEKGPTASACPDGWKRKKNGLCKQSGGSLTMEEEADAKAKRLGLILGLVGAALVLIFVGSVVFFCCYKKKKTHKVIANAMEMGTKGETVPNDSGEDEEEEIDVEEQETIEITM